MRTETHRLVVPCPRADVWRFLSDYRNDLEWQTELTECECIAGVPGEVGARYRAVIGWEGLTSVCEVECCACEFPSVIAYRARLGESVVTCEYRLRENGDDAHVEVTFGLDIGPSYVILEPFAWAMLTRWARVNGAELPRACARALA